MSDEEIVTMFRSIEQQLTKIADALCHSPQSINKDQAYSRQDAARLLGVSTYSIDLARKEGKLVETRRLGTRYVRITGESMLAFQRSRVAGKVQVLKY